MTATLPLAASIMISSLQTDAELVDRFASVRDPAAIEELVHRHRAVVLGVCRRVLRNTCDIEDVFQATFLVLVRDAARVRRQASISGWLYGVAYRLSLRVARQKHRRRETMFVEGDSDERDAFDELACRHDQQLVDAELNALPDRYRLPIVLRYLVGKSPREIAAELNISLGTLDGLIKRGKDHLRARLLQRGVSLGAALVALQFSQQTVHAASMLTLIENTIQTGIAWQCGLNGTSGPISDRILELSGKEMVAMTTMTKAGLGVGLTLSVLTLGIGITGVLNGPNSGRAEASSVSAFRSAVTTMAAAESAVLGLDQPPADVVVPPVSKPAEVTKPGTAPGKANTPGSPAAKLWDRRSRPELVARIEAALRSPTEVSFQDNPLEEACNYLEDLHHINIAIDHKALEEDGVTSDTPVTLAISEVTLKSVLRLMLEPHGLDYVIKNEVMLITTRSTADELRDTRVYDVGRLNGITTSELEEIIRATVCPDSWSADRQPVTRTPVMEPGAGSPGASNIPPSADSNAVQDAASPASAPDGGTIRHTAKRLIIRQSQRIHDEIVELLNQLEESDDQKSPVPKPAGRATF